MQLDEANNLPYTPAPQKSLPQRSFTCVQVPVIVKKDPQRALTMLGGEDAVQDVIEGSKKYLEFKFRPEDKLSHGTHGDNTATNNLLLRVRRVRDTETRKFKIQDTELIGKVVNTIRFRGMSDFQVLQPSVSFSHAPKFKQEQPTENATSILMDEEYGLGDEKPFLPPPIFSRFDLPLEYNFRGNPASTTTRIETESGVVMKRKLKKPIPRYPKSIIIDSDDTSVPREPLEPYPEEDDAEMIELRKLFNERPIWSRTALLANIQSKRLANQLKIKLPYVAYMFQSGPFRQLWIRFGVDPRTDRCYTRYQLLDFRIQREYKDVVKNLRILQGVASEKEMLGGVNNLQRQPKRREKQRGELRQVMSGQPIEEDTEENEWYRFNRLPVQNQTFFQLADIELESVQDLIENPDPNAKVQTTVQDSNGVPRVTHFNIFSENYEPKKDGWLTSTCLHYIRELMKDKVEEWMKELRAEQDNDTPMNVDDDVDD
jgi:general transcription factor 3C polypeptide 5 (transcription factor C subunit 1)